MNYLYIKGRSKNFLDICFLSFIIHTQQNIRGKINATDYQYNSRSKASADQFDHVWLKKYVLSLSAHDRKAHSL